MVIEMENLRKSFDNRSREHPPPPHQQQPGLKKQRLTDEPMPQQQLNRSSFPPQQRQSAAVPPPVRFASRADSNDLRSGGAYQPQMLSQHQELVSQYKAALGELTFNSKPIITNLTIIAGENQHAAKAIAATICSNILEVPTEQKLPSLYLLDSIVKNIGRDYVRYFAARLPEVFSKAYRLVDPAVHPNMRHLFGTWKGVFPPQTLQAIEKELGFGVTANGSSTLAAAPRPDSQSPRPSSIHVNPKYLERQRLQQSSRAKGIGNDMTGVISNTTEDLERPDRTVNIGTVRSWMDPSLKLQSIQQSHRDSQSESVHEFSRNTGLGIGRASGRVVDQVNDKPWRGVNSAVTEAISSQRNGFNGKHGVQNLPATRSSRADVNLELTQSIAGRSSSGVSNSWKNSEEEEFVWDMHSRLPDDDATNVSNQLKKHWISDDPEKLEYEGHLRKPLSVHDVASKFERENSADSLSSEQKEHASYGHRIPSPRLSQEQALIGGPMHSGTSNLVSGHSEGYSSLPARGSSLLGRAGVQPQTGSSHVGSLGQQRLPSLRAVSSSGQSSVHHRPPSPSLSGRLKSLEQDHPQGLPHLRSESSTARPQGRSSRDPLPSLSSNVRLGNSQKLQNQTEHPGLNQNLLPEVSAYGSRLNPEDHSTDPTTETSVQSSTSSLLAAVLKSGILSNNSITGSLTNTSIQKIGQQSLVQPTLSSWHPSNQVSSAGPRTLSGSAVGPSCENSSGSVTPQDKVEQPLLHPSRLTSSNLDGAAAETTSVASDTSNPVSNLLSSLVAKGLISAAKKEAQSKTPPSQDNRQGITSTATVPAPSVPVSSENSISSATANVPFSEPSAKSLVSLPQSTVVETKCLIGVELKPSIIRGFHQHVIDALFDDFPYECSICGLKLKLQERLDRHLEWHGLERTSRGWYAYSEDWVAGRGEPSFGNDSASFMEESEKTSDEGEPMVPADENQCVCILCGELFEDYYSQERDDWMFKGAIYMTGPSGNGEIETSSDSNIKAPIVHANCMSETSVHDLRLSTGVKLEKVV